MEILAIGKAVGTVVTGLDIYQVKLRTLLGRKAHARMAETTEDALEAL